VGLQVGNTVSGAVLVETIFSRNGVGRLAQEAVLRQDIPVVLAIVAVSATAFVVINLIVDLLYPWLDPRITHSPKVA
jgi:peptide/nickel transport system permease protein